MAQHLHVELVLDEYPSNNDDLEKIIGNALRENESEFYELMGRLALGVDMRAVFVEETLGVTSVSADANGGVVSVSFDYSAYYGCKDMDSSDVVEDDWPFVRDGHKLIFDLPLPPERGRDEI